MRVHKEQDGVTVHAIAGTYVVHLGFDVTQARRKALLGFAIQREDRTEGDTKWILNSRCFAGKERDAKAWPSNEAPVQKMRWGDYTAKPGHDYTYRVYAAYGSPDDLRLGKAVPVPITTEHPAGIKHDDGTVHQVYFNRGGAASQAYVNRFQDRSPEDVGEEAFRWLSRGLLEGLDTFIKQAKKGDALHLCVYEFQLDAILEDVREAKARGVKLRILYDAGTGKSSPLKKNEQAITKAKIKAACKRRAGLKSRISHHKFAVHLRNNKPRSVWTGSTNFTRNAVYAQLNVGHAVTHPGIANAYAALHEALWKDPDQKSIRAAIEALGNVAPAKKGTHHFIFSPRSKEDAMTFYLDLLGKASDLLIMTNPFGVDKRIEASFTKLKGPVVKLGMVSTTGQDGGQVQRLDGIDGTNYTRPARMKTALDRWQKESFQGKSHAYIHTKFLLIDPLSTKPILVSGSANFSKASCIYNDENMLVIIGHTGLADVYLTEFLRLFEHYGYRYYVEVLKLNQAPGPLDETNKWTNKYFKQGSRKERDRVLFSGHS